MKVSSQSTGFAAFLRATPAVPTILHWTYQWMKAPTSTPPHLGPKNFTPLSSKIVPHLRQVSLLFTGQGQGLLLDSQVPVSHSMTSFLATLDLEEQLLLELSTGMLHHRSKFPRSPPVHRLTLPADGRRTLLQVLQKQSSGAAISADECILEAQTYELPCGTLHDTDFETMSGCWKMWWDQEPRRLPGWVCSRQVLVNHLSSNISSNIQIIL